MEKLLFPSLLVKKRKIMIVTNFAEWSFHQKYKGWKAKDRKIFPFLSAARKKNYRNFHVKNCLNEIDSPGCLSKFKKYCKANYYLFIYLYLNYIKLKKPI